MRSADRRPRRPSTSAGSSPQARTSAPRTPPAGRLQRRRRAAPARCRPEPTPPARPQPPIRRPTDPARPRRRQLRVVERVEDPVPLTDVQIGLLRRHRPQPGASSPGDSPASQAPRPSAPGTSADRHVTATRPTLARRAGARVGVERLALFRAPELGSRRPRLTEESSGDARTRAPRPTQSNDRYRDPDGRPHFRQVHVLQDRPRLAPPRRRAAGRGQAGVPRRLRGLRPRPLAARLLNHRHARRRRPGPAQPEPQPRRPAHLPRRARPERAGEVGRDALLVPLDDQALAVLGGAGAPGDLRLRAQVPLPLPDGQAARAGTGCRRRSASGS